MTASNGYLYAVRLSSGLIKVGHSIDTYRRTRSICRDFKDEGAKEIGAEIVHHSVRLAEATAHAILSEWWVPHPHSAEIFDVDDAVACKAIEMASFLTASGEIRNLDQLKARYPLYKDRRAKAPRDRSSICVDDDRRSMKRKLKDDDLSRVIAIREDKVNYPTNLDAANALGVHPVTYWSFLKRHGVQMAREKKPTLTADDIGKVAKIYHDGVLYPTAADASKALGVSESTYWRFVRRHKKALINRKPK